VADVALMPERLVFECDLGVATDRPRQATDALAQDGIALMRHRRRALLLRAERFTDLRYLGPLEMPDVGRELLQAPADDGQGGEVGGVAVSSDHLGGHRRDLQA